VERLGPQEKLAGVGNTALAAHREGRFEAADAAWKALLASYPDDPVATTFLARIAAFRSRGFPAEWDGIATLDEK